jgi:hypothetical protein
MKNNSILFFFMFLVLVDNTATAQSPEQPYKSLKFYEKLYTENIYVEKRFSEVTTYILIDSTRNKDSLLATFDSALVKDLMEVKYAKIMVRKESLNGTYNINGLRVKSYETTTTWVVGVRFKAHNKWVPISNHLLIKQYIKLRDPNLASNISKHPERTGAVMFGAGIGLMFGGLLVDGFLLFGWHPYFVPVYFAGATCLAVGAVIYLVNHKNKPLSAVVNTYNAQLNTVK